MKLHQLSQEEMNQLVPGQRTIQDKLLGISGGGESETVTSGALALNTPISFISCTGTQAYTLAAGTFAGQEKLIICSVAASTPIGTLTVSSPSATAGSVLSATHVFNTVGQALHLMWTGSAWRALRTWRAGTVVPIIGTTVLTGYTLNQLYACSVTETVVSATTKGLPDGQFPGDRCTVGCSAVSGTPVGSITFTGISTANAAKTDLQAIGATTDYVVLEWNGLAWVVLVNSGITVA